LQNTPPPRPEEVRVEKTKGYPVRHKTEQTREKFVHYRALERMESYRISMPLFSFRLLDWGCSGMVVVCMCLPMCRLGFWGILRLRTYWTATIPHRGSAFSLLLSTLWKVKERSHDEESEILVCTEVFATLVLFVEAASIVVEAGAVYQQP
jgi:hypothetical protein